MIRMKDEVAVVEHAAGEMAHDGLGLNVEITKHFVRSPSTEQPDNISVDLGKTMVQKKPHFLTDVRAVLGNSFSKCVDYVCTSLCLRKIA